MRLKAFFYLASDLSKIWNKPASLKNALRKKIIQCFIHISANGSRFRGILDGIFKNEPFLKKEYVSFLEQIVEKDSPYRNQKYLDSISLYVEPNTSLVFSLPDKVQILAYQYLLKIDPEHEGALNFFFNYDSTKTISDYKHTFIFSENDWSGNGILNEHGEWVLPPFYRLGISGHGLYNEGISPVLFSTVYKNQHKYTSFGNWVDTKGNFIIDHLVPQPGTFLNGMASCYYHDSPKYVDANGNYLKKLEGKKIKKF